MSCVLAYQTGSRAKLESDRSDGAWYSTTELPSGRDRSQSLCILRRSGSKLETRWTGEWRLPLKQQPPREILEIFTEEYTELLNSLRSRSKFVYLCGDYNIDLLKITTNDVFNKFYENITSSGFIKKKIPTRICDTTSILIDNVDTNAIDKSHICGILIHHIFDHQMYFCVLDETYQRLNNKPK